MLLSGYRFTVYRLQHGGVLQAVLLFKSEVVDFISTVTVILILSVLTLSALRFSVTLRASFPVPP